MQENIAIPYEDIEDLSDTLIHAFNLKEELKKAIPIPGIEIFIEKIKNLQIGYSRINVKLWMGDILNLKVDSIVNAANAWFGNGSGINGMIFERYSSKTPKKK